MKGELPSPAASLPPAPQQPTGIDPRLYRAALEQCAVLTEQLICARAQGAAIAEELSMTRPQLKAIEERVLQLEQDLAAARATPTPEPRAR